MRPGVYAGDGNEVLLETRDGVYLEGRVVQAGDRPVSEGTVRIWRHRSMVRGEETAVGPIQEPDGRFRLGPVSPGRYRISAASPSLGPAPHVHKEVTAPAADVVLRLVPVLRGRVEGGDLRDFEVICVPEDPVHRRGGRRARIHPVDGGFAIPRLQDRPHALLVRGRRDERCALLRGVWPTQGPLVVSLEEGLSIQGRVAVAEGGATTGRIHLESVGLGFRVTVWVGPRGGFRADGLPPGRYALSFSSFDRRVTVPSQVVDAGRRDVRLVEPGTDGPSNPNDPPK